ncbi:MAG: NifU family protein [Flavobacteriales bacterium]
MAIPTNVYAEITPNPAVMKFVADRDLVSGGRQLDFHDRALAAQCAPLAQELFNFPFVTSVFISGSFVAVTKDASLGWEMIVQQLREYIREWLMENELAVDEAKLAALDPTAFSPQSTPSDPSGAEAPADMPIAEEEFLPSEHDEAIISLLDEFVRPAVEQDGGAIDFKAFKDGKVYVMMRGACSGCPSSMQTLKGGIEQLLRSKLEVVEEVVAYS